MSMLDAHLVAIDARTGSLKWNAEVADYSKGYSKTAAPLVVKDLVITGIAGGEYGIRGLLDAYQSQNRRTGMATLYYPRPGRSRPWDLGRRLVENGRLTDVDYRSVRSGPEPRLLGHREPRPRLERRSADGRQPLFRLRAGRQRRQR